MKNERNNPSNSWPISLMVVGVIIGVMLTMGWPEWLSLDDEPTDSGPLVEETVADEPAAETTATASESDAEMREVEEEPEGTIRITSEAEARDYLVGQWCGKNGATVRISVDKDLTMQWDVLDENLDPPWWFDAGSTQGVLRRTSSDRNPDNRAFAIVGHISQRTSDTILLVTVLDDQPVDNGTATGINHTQSALLGEYNHIYDLKDDCDNYPEGGPPPWERKKSTPSRSHHFRSCLAKNENPLRDYSAYHT